MLCCFFAVALPARAYADATAFIGAATTPTNRQVRGFAAGVGLLIVGFEFEYATASTDETTGAPSLQTFMGNVLLQTPIPIAGMQFYVTTGAGGFRERLEPSHQEIQIGLNSGGGVKVSLLGPVRVRLDYRVFK